MFNLRKLFLLVVLFVTTTVIAADIEVGVAWEGKSGMTKRVMSGVTEYLEKNAPQIKLEIAPELEDTAALDKAVKSYEKSKKAMLVLRSNGVKYLKENPTSLPTFIGGCNDPKELGIINNVEAPEGNITGVTYALAAEVQFETFVAILPKMESIMLLVEKGHPGTVIDQQQIKAVCAKLKIKYNETICETKEQIVDAVKANSGKVSAFIIGNQAMVFDNTKDIVAAAGNVPALCSQSKPVSAGALCGFAADDVKLGKMLAAQLVEVVVNGKAVKDIPIGYDSKPQLFINVDTAEKLKIEIPFQVLKAAKVVSSKQ